MPNEFFSLETRAGEAISVGDTKVIPFSQVLHLKFPRLNGGLIWNRPVSVLAVAPDGEERIIPIQDATRRAQLSILAAGLVGSLLIWLLYQTKQARKE